MSSKKWTCAVFADVGGEVEDDDGERRLEVDLVVVGAVVHGVLDLVEVPVAGGLALLVEHPDGEFVGLLDADAAVGEVAAGALEELRLRGGVEVDVVLVGEHELDQAEGVFGAGLLADDDAAVLDLLRRRR